MKDNNAEQKFCIWKWKLKQVVVQAYNFFVDRAISDNEDPCGPHGSSSVASRT